MRYGGEGGIRTRDPGCPRYRFSKPALSTTQPPLPDFDAEQDASTIVKAPWQRPIFPHLAVQYRQRYDVSLPCSGWERVVPSRSYHQGASAIFVTRTGHFAGALVAGAGFEPATSGL